MNYTDKLNANQSKIKKMIESAWQLVINAQASLYVAEVTENMMKSKLPAGRKTATINKARTIAVIHLDRLRTRPLDVNFGP